MPVQDLVTVQTLLGHQRLDTTARYTNPPIAGDLEEAVGRLDDEPCGVLVAARCARPRSERSSSNPGSAGKTPRTETMSA